MGYGRIVRNAACEIQAIVEKKDASPEQLEINEVNTGILSLYANYLNEWLHKLSSNNAQGEYYITDIIAMAVSQVVAVSAIHPQDEYEVQGVIFFFNDTATTEIYTLSLHDALPI